MRLILVLVACVHLVCWLVCINGVSYWCASKAVNQCIRHLTTTLDLTHSTLFNLCHPCLNLIFPVSNPSNIFHFFWSFLLVQFCSNLDGVPYILVCGYPPAYPGSEASKQDLASRTLMSVSQNMWIWLSDMWFDFTVQQEIYSKKNWADLEQNVKICFPFTIASPPDHLARFPTKKVAHIAKPANWYISSKKGFVKKYPSNQAFVKKLLFSK